MKLAYTLLAVGLLGCSSELPTDNQFDAGMPLDSGVSCEDVSTPDPCTRSDGFPGHCAFGQCVISCETSTDCPESTCRFPSCVSNMCQYFPVEDGTACVIGDKVSACESYVCVVIP